MANLPEKNVVLVDKITNVPTDSNLFINANGEFKQASVNDVVNSSTVVSTAVETAINTAVQDSIDSNFKQTSGSPILLTDSADGTLIDFKGKGRSTQNGTPTPDNPIDIVSVADSGYFDRELATGYYNNDGTVNGTAQYVSAKNLMPCNVGDVIKFTYAETVTKLVILFFDDTKYLSQVGADNSATINATAPSGATRFGITIHSLNGITPQTAKHITVTINGKYALIVKSKGKNLLKNTIIEQTTNGITFNKNDDESFSISGTATQNNSYAIGTVTLPKGTYVLSGCTKGSNATYFVYISSPYLEVTNAEKSFTLAQETTLTILIRYISGATINDTIYPMIRPVSTDDTYEPYKEEVKYIPLNEPLRSSLDGSVTDEVSLSENKVTRRIVRKRIVTVSKNNSTDVNNYCYYCALGNVGRSNGGISNNLPNLLLYEITINGTENIGQYVSAEYGGVVYINVGKHLTENTVEGMTKWLSENPTYIQYELAEPVVETIEPVDIVTYDNVTYLTASDNAEMEIEYPTTKVAGIASIGYSKGIKAEYETEQLKKQLLEIQATIVNTL